MASLRTRRQRTTCPPHGWLRPRVGRSCAPSSAYGRVERQRHSRLRPRVGRPCAPSSAYGPALKGNTLAGCVPVSTVSNQGLGRENLANSLLYAQFLRVILVFAQTSTRASHCASLDTTLGHRSCSSEPPPPLSTPTTVENPLRCCGMASRALATAQLKLQLKATPM